MTESSKKSVKTWQCKAKQSKTKQNETKGNKTKRMMRQQKSTEGITPLDKYPGDCEEWSTAPMAMANNDSSSNDNIE